MFPLLSAPWGPTLTGTAERDRRKRKKGAGGERASPGPFQGRAYFLSEEVDGQFAGQTLSPLAPESESVHVLRTMLATLSGMGT